MTAVPPRPAAPDCTCGHDGLPANFHMTPCPIKVAHFARLAAPDATAGDGLREVLRSWFHDNVYDPSVYSTVLPRPTAVTPARRAAQEREALEAVRRVRDLHRSVPLKRGADRVCSHSGQEWPCATIRALAAETAGAGS